VQNTSTYETFQNHWKLLRSNILETYSKSISALSMTIQENNLTQWWSQFRDMEKEISKLSDYNLTHMELDSELNECANIAKGVQSIQLISLLEEVEIQIITSTSYSVLRQCEQQLADISQVHQIITGKSPYQNQPLTEKFTYLATLVEQKKQGLANESSEKIGEISQILNELDNQLQSANSVEMSESIENQLKALAQSLMEWEDYSKDAGNMHQVEWCRIGLNRIEELLKSIKKAVTAETVAMDFFDFEDYEQQSEGEDDEEGNGYDTDE